LTATSLELIGGSVLSASATVSVSHDSPRASRSTLGNFIFDRSLISVNLHPVEPQSGQSNQITDLLIEPSQVRVAFLTDFVVMV
jgi:hypothetical protein